MRQPSLDELLTKVDSRYTLVSLVAKRARELTKQIQENSGEEFEKAVTTALFEVAEGKISYVLPKRKNKNLK